MDTRKKFLIVDNCPGHPKTIEGLQNVELLFLPPKTTLKTQPCDAGIIRAFKMHYCRRFYRGLLKGYELGPSNPEKINALDAMNLAISAWTIDVRASTLSNCFRHCKLRSTDNTSLENLDEHTNGEFTRDLQNLIKKLGYHNSMNVEDVQKYPEKKEVTQLLTDEEIIEKVVGTDKDVEEEDESSTIEPPSRNEAIKAAKRILPMS
ncbi:CENP-B homolog protein 2-like [Papaver somniferum]|uniref:CENP-B homolog protein 2-like n=1 Tax=Papaver somniferum TaxID=3469 RepID=UPI000E7009BF|nr:CENP-B homolog protein 2-like [Papaver somniferum]